MRQTEIEIKDLRWFSRLVFAWRILAQGRIVIYPHSMQLNGREVDGNAVLFAAIESSGAQHE